MSPRLWRSNRFWDCLAGNMTEVPFNSMGTFYVLKTAAAAALLYPSSEPLDCCSFLQAALQRDVPKSLSPLRATELPSAAIGIPN